MLALIAGLALATADSLPSPVFPEPPRGDSAVGAPERDGSARGVAFAPVGPDSAARDSLRRPRLDYLWVVRTSLLSRQSIEQVVERAKGTGARGLLVQVVGRGDGWYRSELLPRPEALADTAFDPLGELLPRARAAGLEVHAWMNCALVWSAPRPPRDPRHVIRSHPEWVVRLTGGRPMTLVGPRERRRLGVEGVYLNPVHEGVRTWIARIAREIAARYPVDGIQLDYIRGPGVPLESDPESRVGFALEHGVDPQRMGRLPPARRAELDSLWVAWQGGQVTAVVREVRDSLERLRPGIALSAAVLADPASAERRHAQPWLRWLRDGLLDRAFVMCYAPAVQTVLEQLLLYVEEPGVAGRLVPGIAVFNSTPADAAAKIKGALELGFRALALYSYDSLFERADTWPALRGFLGIPEKP